MLLWADEKAAVVGEAWEDADGREMKRPVTDGDRPFRSSRNWRQPPPAMQNPVADVHVPAGSNAAAPLRPPNPSPRSAGR